MSGVESCPQGGGGGGGKGGGERRVEKTGQESNDVLFKTHHIGKGA